MLTKVERPITEQPKTNGHSSPADVLQAALQLPRPDEPFPYLEDIMSAASKYPYSALGIMIGIASVVIAAVVTVAVAGFTGVFLMYGEMTNTRAKLDTILEQQTEIKGQVSVIKTIHQSTLARQDFMNGLMSKENQDALNAYDRTHPRTAPPESTEERKQ